MSSVFMMTSTVTPQKAAKKMECPAAPRAPPPPRRSRVGWPRRNLVQSFPEVLPVFIEDHGAISPPAHQRRVQAIKEPEE